jgi:uncharacterized protein (TIGR00255 family)
MTGFGRSQLELPGKTITIEIKSLNSKQLDLNLRTPSLYREKDLEIRSLLSQRLERGRVDFSLNVELTGEEEKAFTINKTLALNYYGQLKELSESIPESRSGCDFLAILLRMPDVLKAEKEQLDETEWHLIEECIGLALDDLDRFRLNEGKTLLADIEQRVHLITGKLEEIGPYESPRIEALRERILGGLRDLPNSVTFDPNRFEQEMIYYMERLDITEEKVRLEKHCDYFLETLRDEASAGKKLGFITQEIGREINTLGSKANDAHIQKLVVGMKDELEKIKEQLFNIL